MLRVKIGNSNPCPAQDVVHPSWPLWISNASYMACRSHSSNQTKVSSQPKKILTHQRTHMWGPNFVTPQLIHHGGIGPRRTHHRARRRTVWRAWRGSVKRQATVSPSNSTRSPRESSRTTDPKGHDSPGHWQAACVEENVARTDESVSVTAPDVAGSRGSSGRFVFFLGFSVYLKPWVGLVSPHASKLFFLYISPSSHLSLSFSLFSLYVGCLLLLLLVLVVVCLLFFSSISLSLDLLFHDGSSFYYCKRDWI